MNKKLLLASLLLSQVAATNAATVAIIDSGVDMLHEVIAPRAWENLGEIRRNDVDDDNNGYVDDYNGWNFAENNRDVIDYKYLGMLDARIRKFFDTQTKMLLGTATEEDIAWLKAQTEDKEFLKKLQTYGNFMHGTHVAGIASKGGVDNKVMAIKLLPTEVKLPFSVNPDDKNGFVITLVKQGLGLLAKQQTKLLENISKYIDSHRADVANGSFGTGFNQAAMIVKPLLEAALRRAPTDEEVVDVANHFINTLVREGVHMVGAASDTLFVYAAGNDGTDNDKLPTFPANIKAENVITVAAMRGTTDLAKFSNFGARSVDVAAPGVAIESSVPGNQYLQVSGTSQAAPYVANIAAKVKDMNAKLSPSEIRKVITGTVDRRGDLAGKVKFGLVNMERAVKAAELSKSNSLAQAIQMAVQAVGDQAIVGHDKNGEAEFVQAAVLPLPSLFR